MRTDLPPCAVRCAPTPDNVRMHAFVPLNLLPSAPAAPAQRWDIFCQVIDNFGDIGVCWRLAAELAHQGHQVQLRIDDASALAWMAPQGHPGVQVLDYRAAWDATQPPQVVVEAFGCEAPAPYLQALSQAHIAAQRAQAPRPVLLNLEYLSAESYVERCHRLPSPILSGPGTGLTRWFFYPGFTERTGGLLRESTLPAAQQALDRTAARTALGLQPGDTALSLFCYEPPALPALLAQLGPDSALPQPRVLVTPGRAAAAVHTCTHSAATLDLAPRSQVAFDSLLWACDVNLVRGEDSLVRALWAGQPFVWHIYPQDDDAHYAKLQAFLDWLQAPASLRAFHHAWNGITAPDTLPQLTPRMLQEWATCILAARARLTAQASLITQLQLFVAEKR